MTDHASPEQQGFRSGLRRDAYALPQASAEGSREDGYMSCPCGRGDYDLCEGCPYDWCSVHGETGKRSEGRDGQRTL